MSRGLSVACPHCAQSLPVEYADRLIYDLICPHCMQPFCLFVRRQKFEVLFELGTEALLAGYAREAVSSFAAALERCFEFYVRAYALEQAAGQGLQGRQRLVLGDGGLQGGVGGAVERGHVVPLAQKTHVGRGQAAQRSLEIAGAHEHER